jgi:chemotaxis receptor (MCP) glutamine deamidase CheD
MWWAALEWVLHVFEPLYKALRYADTQKKCTLSGFKKSMMSAIQEMEAHLGGGSEMFHRIMSKVSKRIQAMQNDTLMVAGSDKLLKLILSCFFPFLSYSF